MSAPRPVGRTAWLLDCGDGEAAAGTMASVTAAADAGALHGVTGVRRGARTVLVTLATPGQSRAAGPVLAALPTAGARAAVGVLHELDVVYDGPDLEAVAAELGVSVEALVAEHAAATWRAQFCGFAPGFAYLTGWSRAVARLTTPRTRVPAGAVGLAGTWSAAYPSDSPGGWRLLGRTDAALWDAARAAPALVAPGDAVRWRPVREHVAVAERASAAAVERLGEPGEPDADRAQDTADEALAPAVDGRLEVPAHGLRVLEPGALTLVEDLGRPGLEHLGVPPSGATDRAAARRANRAVGNPAGAALLENVGGLTVDAAGDLVVAVVGPVGRVRVERGTASPGATDGDADGDDAPPGHAIALPGGTALRVVVDGPHRVYLAVRGGLATPRVLGSRSADALGRLAWRPVRSGDVLPVGPAAGVVGTPEPPEEPRDGPLRVVLGPRADRFVDPTVLLAEPWTVGPDSNRVGLRLRGVPLAWAVPDELESEPMVAGAVQVPASGLPVVLLRDHPTTGGYPMVAVVVAEDLDRLAGLAPGDTVRFVAVTP